MLICFGFDISLVNKILLSLRFSLLSLLLLRSFEYKPKNNNNIKKPIKMQ